MILQASSRSTVTAGCSSPSFFSRDESILPSHRRNYGRHVMEKSIFFRGDFVVNVPGFVCRRKCYGFLPAEKDHRPRKVLVSPRSLERRPSSLDKWLEDGTSSSTRWDKVKSRHSPKEQWKPSKPSSTVGGQRMRDDLDSQEEQVPVEVLVQGGHDPEAGVYEEPVQLHKRILEEAKKRAIAAKDYLENFNLKKEVIVAKHYVENFDAKKKAIAAKNYVQNFDAKKQAIAAKNCVQNFDVKKLLSTVEHSSYPHLPPVAGTMIVSLGAVLLSGIVLDALVWRVSRGSSSRNNMPSIEDGEGGRESLRSRAPSALSMLLERDLRRKESVEWVNMVVGKLWNLYRRALENWLVGLLQPIIDDLEKPDYVTKVEVKQFFLGDEPLTVRTVERRTSRRVDDLQYHIGVRYTGGARLLLAITLKWGILSLTIPVGVRGLDVDAEVWVKIRMLPSDPWVGQATWAFVTLPNIKLALAPFRILNLMAIPFLSMFLAKLLTEDLPMLFVRPNKNVVDFLQGRVVGPVSKDFKDGITLDESRSFSGELSVTLVEARRLNNIPYLKTDPYCIFVLGEQVLRSKRNSQTSSIGPPGSPVWNQDFKLLVVDHKLQHLSVTVHDTLGFTSYPVGSGDIDLRTLQDTVPIDRKLPLKSGWGPFPKRFAGELILRLTYKAYIDEEEEEGGGELQPKGFGIVDIPGAVEQVQETAIFFKEEAGKVAEFFQEKDVAQEIFSSLSTITADKDLENALPILGLEKQDKTEPDDIKSEADSYAPGAMPSANGFLKTGAEEFASNSGTGSKNLSDGSPAVKVEGEEVIVSNKAGEDLGSSSVQVNRARRNQVFFWLAIATGIIWIVAADLNLTNLFNP